MSEDQQDQVERADDERADEDVEAHSIEGPVDSPHAGAIEEPPDVEGHGFHGSPVQPKPID